ncbi:MAG: cytochrome c oxidase assembly protein [Actinomycetota bacterium]
MRIWYFIAGLVIALVALFSPLENMATELFSAHMVQHLILVFVVPPQFVAGWPSARRIPALLTVPLVVLVVHATAMWVWHLPVLYDAALANDLVHMLEHMSFLVTGLLFWGVVSARFRDLDRLPRVGLVFGTALASGALGAVLAFASAPLYESHLQTTEDWGLTALEDQQLAGGIMWVPPGVVYLVVMLVLLARWLNAMDTDAAATGGAR